MSILLSYAINLKTQTQGSAIADSISSAPLQLKSTNLTNAKDFKYRMSLSPNETRTLDLLSIDITYLRCLLITAPTKLTITIDNQTPVTLAVLFQDYGDPNPLPIRTTPYNITVLNPTATLADVVVIGVGY